MRPRQIRRGVVDSLRGVGAVDVRFNEAPADSPGSIGAFMPPQYAPLQLQ